MTNSYFDLVQFEANLDILKPKDIVKQLDQYIVGQEKAKRLVAIALRNRIRRKAVPEEMRKEISPKNILMIGSTGVGKTEIARRMANLSDAPFVKVEATKFTERGYVGRDVEYMIRSLVSHSVNKVKARMKENVKFKIDSEVNKELLKVIWKAFVANSQISEETLTLEKKKQEKSKLKKKFLSGKLEDFEVKISVKRKVNVFPMAEMFPGMDDLEESASALFNLNSESDEIRSLTVREARNTLIQQKQEEYIDKDRAIEIGVKWAQEMGIVFIDEIDKIVTQSGSDKNADVSQEGVQRDILPIIEGTTVNTKYGVIKTDSILFIAAGAFHVSKPSDLIPELQGRFPIRVELNNLSKTDLRRILVEPKNSLIKQYQALLLVEKVKLEFEDSAYDKIVEIAHEINSMVEDIGARRLQTVMEFLLEDISFDASEKSGETVKITAQNVVNKLESMIKNTDMTKYIL